MAAVQVEHIRLEAGHFQTHAVILALLCKALLVCFVLDLVCTVVCLLQQFVGIADDIITAIGNMGNADVAPDDADQGAAEPASIDTDDNSDK